MWLSVGLGIILFGHMLGFIWALGDDASPPPKRGKLVPVKVLAG